MPTVDQFSTQGTIAHDAVDSGNPVKVGMKAIAHGTNPTAVAAADRSDLLCNRHGIPYFLGGHPNLKNAVYNTTAAQTDDNILPAISAGTKYVITGIIVVVSTAVTVNPSVTIGFGASTNPALGASGADAVDKLIIRHGGIAPGSGITVGFNGAIVGIGGDGEELRITNSVPTTGNISISVQYFTIES
jgi:hypothetical protein